MRYLVVVLAVWVNLVERLRAAEYGASKAFTADRPATGALAEL